MPIFIFGAWAIMAWLKGQQPEAERVRLLLESGEKRERRLVMNIVNLGEVFYLSVKANDAAYGNRVLRNLQARITIVSADDELVMSAAALKARHAISYADAFAAATAMRYEAPLVTGDPELRAMAKREGKLKLEWVAA